MSPKYSHHDTGRQHNQQCSGINTSSFQSIKTSISPDCCDYEWPLSFISCAEVHRPGTTIQHCQILRYISPTLCHFVIAVVIGHASKACTENIMDRIDPSFLFHILAIRKEWSTWQSPWTQQLGLELELGRFVNGTARRPLTPVTSTYWIVDLPLYRVPISVIIRTLWLAYLMRSAMRGTVLLASWVINTLIAQTWHWLVARIDYKITSTRCRMRYQNGQSHHEPQLHWTWSWIDSLLGNVGQLRSHQIR